jgi:glycosyltransferase involved in cell wall biosynthesis
VSGLIYRSRQELVAYLRDLLASPAEVRELGTSAQRVARAHTWEKVAERVSGAYARVARGSKA